MSKRNQDFDLYAGESKVIFIKLDNADGTPFDPAGSMMEWRLAKTSHSDATLQKTLGSGLILSTGGVNVVLDSADTYDLRPEIWYHELKVMTGDKVAVTTVGHVHLRPALDMRGSVSAIAKPATVSPVATVTQPAPPPPPTPREVLAQSPRVMMANPGRNKPRRR